MVEDLTTIEVDLQSEDGDVEYQKDDNGEFITDDDGNKVPVREEAILKKDFDSYREKLESEIEELRQKSKEKDENFKKLRQKLGGDKSSDESTEEKPDVDINEVVKQQLQEERVNTKVEQAFEQHFGKDNDSKELAKEIFNTLYKHGQNMDVDKRIEQSINAVSGNKSSKHNYSSRSEVGSSTKGTEKQEELSSLAKSLENQLSSKRDGFMRKLGRVNK